MNKDNNAITASSSEVYLALQECAEARQDLASCPLSLTQLSQILERIGVTNLSREDSFRHLQGYLKEKNIPANTIFQWLEQRGILNDCELIVKVYFPLFIILFPDRARADFAKVGFTLTSSI